jgi:hypothetical protein
MSEINHFNFFLLYSSDVAADVDHLHVKRIHLVCQENTLSEFLLYSYM